MAWIAAEHRRSGARPARSRRGLWPRATAGRRRVAGKRRRSQPHRRNVLPPSDPGDRIWCRNFARRSCHRAVRRHLHRFLAHERGAVGESSRCRLRRAARRHARAAEFLPARHGAVLSGRSGCERDARRHGFDARLRHDDDPLRRDDAQRAGAADRARRRPHRARRHARREILHGLRPRAIAGGLGRHARRDHRDHVAPVWRSGNDGGRDVRVSGAARRRRCRRRDHPVRRVGVAHRVPRRVAGARLQPIFAAVDARATDAVPGIQRHLRQRRRPGCARAKKSHSPTAALHSNGQRTTPSAHDCGKRVTRRTSQRWHCGRAASAS